MRTGKALGVALGCALAVFLAAMAAVWVLVNPNDYKPRIAAAVREATGRDLDLPGDLRLSVFPWLALEMGPASLGNPPGFDGQAFLSFTHASVRVRLLPLLVKRFEIGRVEVDGLELRLARNALGQGNWVGFGRPAAPPADTAPPTDAAPTANRAAARTAAWDGIAGLKLTHARVSYGQLTLDDIDLETGSIARQGQVPVKLHLDANRGLPDEQVSLDARFDVRADPGMRHFAVAALNMNCAARLAAHSRSDHFGAAAAAFDIDFEHQSVAIPAMTLNTDGAVATASLEAMNWSDAPRVTGAVTLAPLVLREWMARWGLAVPATRDPKALSSLAASTRFEYADHALKFTELTATLDDTRISGGATLEITDRRAAFDLAMDRIDLDRYRPPATQGSPAASGEPGESPSPGESLSPGKSPSSGVSPSPGESPSSGVSPSPAQSPATARVPAAPGSPAAGDAQASLPLEANGTLSVGSVQVASLRLENVRMTVATQNDVMRFHPLTAEIDGGHYSGDITVDHRAPLTVLSLDEHLTGVDVGRLLAQDPGQIRLSGRANLDFKATGRGAGADAVLRTLDGHVDARITHGALEGVDLGFQLGRAAALLQGQGGPRASDSGRTPFEAFEMSAQITGGVASTHDLLISAAALKITGQGTANLATQALDVALLADALKTLGGTPIQVPVTVRGTFASPDIRPDLQALARGELKDKVKDLLKERLQDLFGKP